MAPRLQRRLGWAGSSARDRRKASTAFSSWPALTAASARPFQTRVDPGRTPRPARRRGRRRPACPLREDEGQPDPGRGLVGVDGDRAPELVRRAFEIAGHFEGVREVEGLIRGIPRVEADGLADVGERLPPPADLVQSDHQGPTGPGIAGREADRLLEERDAQLEASAAM